MRRRPDDVTAPVRRSISVSWSPEAAYRRFTADFSGWWPSYGHSIGGRRVKRIVFEARVGGRIFEEHHDGTRFLWGTVTALEPPRRVRFTHHASHAAADAQEVEVSFTPEGIGTRVDLVARGWEKMGERARRARGGYVMTWGAALDAFAGRLSGVRLLFIVMSTAMDLTGQRATFIRHSLSRLPAQEDE
jgi:uncharacterized protein YndB with AHSA1/START domain